MTCRNFVTMMALASLAAGVSDLFAADSITRRDGTRVAGTITGGTKTELTIKPSIGDPVAIPAADIALVDWDAATADLKLGLSDENGGRFDSAIQRVTKSKTETSDASDLLKKDYDFILARIAARSALADPSKVDGAASQLDAFLKSGSDHFRYYEALAWLGQMQMVKGDFDAAKATFTKLGDGPSPDHKLAAKIAQGRIFLKQGQGDQAAQSFADAISSAGNSATEQARKFEAMLGKAQALATQGKHPEALEILEEVINKSSASASSVQAEAYVLQGNSLQALNRNKEAVLAYLHVDLLFPKEAGFHAESLYNMARLWKTVQAPERGDDAAARLGSLYPNSSWNKKLSEAPNS